MELNKIQQPAGLVVRHSNVLTHFCVLKLSVLDKSTPNVSVFFQGAKPDLVQFKIELVFFTK